MTLFDAFRFDGKRVLVVGGATGMGAAAAEVALSAGAEVVFAAHNAPVTLAGVKVIPIDLADAASIDAAVDLVGGPVHAVLAASGVADGTPGLERINFLGHRRLIEGLLAADLLPRGSAIGLISSSAGLGWESNLLAIQEFLAIVDFHEASRWAVENNNATYMLSKQAVCAYTAAQALPLLRKGIRINALCPGTTDTPLARATPQRWLEFGSDYRAAAGIDHATPLDQAYPLLFLCSDAAAGITGIALNADSGYISSGLSGSFPDARQAVGYLIGR